MVAIITTQTRLKNSNLFLDSLSNGTSVYMFVGKVSEWADDLSPPTPVNSLETIRDSWNDMIGGKEITAADVSHVTRRNNWVSGVVYTQYVDDNTGIWNLPFYVLTDDYNVYKCIYNNNGGASTVKPTGTGTAIVSTADGYEWKYMYTISTASALKFLTPTWMPVQTLSADDGSSQWTVQENVIDGAIYTITVDSGGNGYGSTPTVAIVGDGTGAVATATISSGTVTEITVSDPGSGYTKAEIVFSGGSPSSAATATAVLSPFSGHGSDAVSELGGFYVMLSTDFIGDEDGAITIANDFRKVGLVTDPFEFGTETEASLTNFDQSYKITLEAGYTETFAVDDTVEGAVSGSTGTVIDFNTDTRVLRVVETNNEFDVGEGLTSSSGGAGTIDVISTPDLEPRSGRMIYIENRSPIIRSEAQTEETRIVLEF